MAWITLHVGLGTFLPIRSEEIEDHAMHEEYFPIPRATKDLVDAALAEGSEGAWRSARRWSARWNQPGTEGGLREGDGRTRIYITPGHRFRVVKQLFTNFHTPRSSLLVLVSAFAGREVILQSYEEAVAPPVSIFLIWRCNVDQVTRGCGTGATVPIA